MNETPPSSEAHVWSYEGYNLEPGAFATALIHLYRAEVSRANLWRSRLDTTTNWAVVTTAASLTFVFSEASNPHFVLLLVLVLVLTFLLIEARRYSYYALWYHRVRLLETGFFSAMISAPFKPTEGWGKTLSDTLTDPRFMVSRWHAVGIRYRRNYIWLITLILISWLLKLGIHPTPVSSAALLIERAAIGAFLSGPQVITVVAAVYLSLLGLMLYAIVKHNMGQGNRRWRPSNYADLGVQGWEDERERLAIIITSHKEVLAPPLMDGLKRSITALNGTGMYTGEERDVLLLAFTESQVEQLLEIVHDVDPAAFMILTDAHDVRGLGFAPFEAPH